MRILWWGVGGEVGAEGGGRDEGARGEWVEDAGEGDVGGCVERGF